MLLSALFVLPYTNVWVDTSAPPPAATLSLKKALDQAGQDERVSGGVGSEPEIWRDNGKLFHFLFSDEFSKWISRDPNAMNFLSLRFSRPYPKSPLEPHALQTELAARLGILRALEQGRLARARPLYLRILKGSSEHWLVKRQALRALQLIEGGFASEKERDDLLTSLDPRAATTAIYTDEQLLERLQGGG